MHNAQTLIRSNRTLANLGFLALAMLLFSHQAVLAVFSPVGCRNNNVNVGLSRTGVAGGRTGGQAHVGEFIDYVVTIDNTAPFNCDVSGATVTLNLADGTSILVVTNLDIHGNASASGG